MEAICHLMLALLCKAEAESANSTAVFAGDKDTTTGHSTCIKFACLRQGQVTSAECRV